MTALSSVILEGLAASIPTFGIPGRLYFATDTGAIYYDTGSAWNAVGAGGGSGPVIAVTGTAPIASSGGTNPAISISANIPKSVVGITVDGGGSVPATGIKGFVQVPYAGTITGWSIVADQSGSASFDIWKVAGTAPPTAPVVPSSGNKISASAPAAISSAQSAAGGSSAISTWTTTVAAWDTFAFNLSSVTTATRITLELQITRT